ncbi:uncharacterized protein BJX67DRAFT_305633 [Aspergillus lucknowensis]|uniref:Uncharacterized protein n=1 Tax=Aspergillus lucknowensis TaxID=176173 RepID=A0ABR4M045_9EURO
MSNHQKRGSPDRRSPRATQPEPDNDENIPAASTNNDHDTRSLASRVQTSASGLARNAFLSATPGGDTANPLSDGSKPALPSSSSAAFRAVEQYRESSGSSSSASRVQTGYDHAETFRSLPTTHPAGFELPRLTEDEFQATYGGDLSEATTDITSKGKGKGREAEIESHPNDLLDPTALFPTDGAAVVSILTDETFDPEFPLSANEPPEYIHTELVPPQLTPDEIRIIESFRRQLPSELQTQQGSNSTRQLSSLSLVPDVGSFLDTLSNPNTSHATTLRDEVLTNLPGATDWLTVEERYHDEVWGYLQPTLEAAAKEMQESKNSPKNSDGPALRRLKLILNHMQH